MKYILIFISSFYISNANSQPDSTNKWEFGVEADALPYITGGYFGGVCAGKNNWRIRALTAFVKKPDFTTRSGFANHRIHAYVIVADYFFKQDWRGFWIGGGLVYWKRTIQSDLKLQTGTFKNYLLNGSSGYNFPLSKHLYLSPWAGMSLKIAGDKNIEVDTKKYTLPLLNPEAPLKIGFYF
ncbi:MAG: hypothetical protein HYX40_02980 [Sphingobacteriales bacterium]|nr:hypothetical protein [Sphingobacteriales bacterium]